MIFGIDDIWMWCVVIEATIVIAIYLFFKYLNPGYKVTDIRHVKVAAKPKDEETKYEKEVYND